MSEPGDVGEEGGRTSGEKTLLLKKGLVVLLLILIVLYIVLWFMGFGTSIWVGIISGLFLIILLVLALVQKFRG